jgi:alkylhydroperoxidase/carboxymuconolactone decarboxylase family protein YurZ
MAAADEINEGNLSPETVMARFVAERGDIFEEFHFMAREMPETVNLVRRTAGYVHYYENQTTADQELSGPMRELIALCQLCAQGDDRFAANHVRRLYRMGVTNRAMFEAAASIAPVVGWSTISHVAQAILTANKPEYPYGVLPPGGEPATLTPFPELSIGRERNRTSSESLLDTPEWKYIAEIDPELARRAAAFVDHCLLPRGAADELLGPGPRELVAIAALCVRGEVDLAAQHIRRAYAYGMNRRQVLEAISCVLPMTGAVTVQIGARAMQQADQDTSAQASVS